MFLDTGWCMQVGSDEVVQFIAQKALEVIEGSGSSPMAQAQPSTEALCAREAPVRAGRSQAGRSAARYPSIPLSEIIAHSYFSA